MNSTEIETQIQRLTNLHPRLIDLSLDRMRRLLSMLDHPERKLPPTIHIAGTNGKGSVIAFMRALLETRGYGVHVYTSPHLIAFNERIRLAGSLVSDACLLEALQQCERANNGAPITIFEITTAAALLLFSRVSADILLLEVGLGGRLDATNVIGSNACAVITPVGYDHQAYLGDSLQQISREKAGVMRAGCPCIIGPQPEEAASEINNYAQELGAAARRYGHEFAVIENEKGMIYRDENSEIAFPPLGLPGRHQFGNAAIAVAALKAAGFLQTSDRDMTALKGAHWPARLQCLDARNFPEISGECEIWLDGGHNADAGQAIANFFLDRASGSEPPLLMLCAMMANKDHHDFLSPFAGLVRQIFTVPLAGHEGVDPHDLAGFARQAGIDANAYDNLDPALAAINSYIEQIDGRRARILICGSLYLAGDILHRCNIKLT